MGAQQQNSLLDTAESLIGWWRAAGVDTVVGEKPVRWLRPSLAAPMPAAARAPDAAKLPADHGAFLEWLRSDDHTEAGPVNRRLLPAGDRSCGLMILADFPEACDIEAGQHMSGPLADLFERMLGALKRTRDTVYIATLTPGRPPAGQLTAEHIAALRPIACHHVRLVAPRQLWLMGGAASRAILWVDDAAARGKVHLVNLDGIIVNAIATAHPRLFEGSKARKAAAWTEMQRLIVEDTQ